jgi:hypothetical protein
MSDTAVPMDLEMEYLTRREAQERAAAEQSVDLTARRVHSELANRYATRRRGGERPATV